MRVEWIALTAGIIAMSAIFFEPIRDGITEAVGNIMPASTECPASDEPCTEFRERR